KVTLTSNPLTCSSVTAINLYIDNVLATDVVISSKTTLINNYAFYKCANITSVTIADTVTSIGQYAFRNCTALKEVTIGSGVTSIGQYAFNSCTALTSVFFMQLANFSVGSSAFISNSSLVAYYFVSQDILNTIKTNYNTESITGYFTNTNFYLCCVVSFESSGGSECPKMGFVSGSSYGSLPTPTREGYRFAGWYTNSALTGSAVSTSTTASASHTLYAKWTFDGIDVVVSGASTSLSSSSVEMDEYNATVIVKPKAGYYISEFSFDNSVFIPVECYTTSIRDIPFAWSVTYYASKANNRLIFSFEYVDLDCLENGQLATIYLKTTTTPYASLKETTGAISISGVAVSATLGGSVTLIGDAYESLADSDTITCVAKVCVPGYEFDGWYSADDMGTCLSDADSKRFTKTEIYEKQIIAVFKPIENTSVNDNVSN
ncbi:MAG: leucine-rich repeat protein, partial [Clostridia bacterium]|nr:leucine-rich repeat protein [Clostridia bacterium]